MLTADQAALVKGMLARGDKQHDIAAFFGENGGRIAEIKTGLRYSEIKPASKKDLPLPSAMAAGYWVYEAKQALLRARLGIDNALANLSDAERRRGLQ